jgi:hypothetical protein
VQAECTPTTSEASHVAHTAQLDSPIPLAHDFGVATLEELYLASPERSAKHPVMSEAALQEVLGQAILFTRKRIQDIAVPSIEELVGKHGGEIRRGFTTTDESLESQLLGTTIRVKVSNEVVAGIDPALLDEVVAEQVLKPLDNYVFRLLSRKRKTRLYRDNAIPLENESSSRDYSSPVGALLKRVRTILRAGV